MANVQIDSMTDTWNAGGTTFNAIKMNVTDTASAAASKLIDLQVGGNTKANVTKAGLLTLASGVTLTGANTLQTTTGALTLVSGSSNIVLTPSSNVGIGTTGPDKKLDVLDASAAQLRLTHTDGSVYTDFQTLSTGHQLMTTSGGNRITSTTVNDTSVLARQVQGGLAFDGVTTTAKDIHTIANIGTSDFSISATFLVPTDTASDHPIILLGSSTTSSAVAGALYVTTVSDLLDIVWYGSTTLDYNEYRFSSFNTTYGGKIVTYTLTKTGSTITHYIQGIATTPSSSPTGGTPPLTNSGSVLSTYAILGFRTSAALFNSTIFSATLFNRALSASEVITLANQGVSEADKWGSLAGTVSNFSAGVDGWGVQNGAATGNVDSIGGQDDVLQFIASNTSGGHWISKVPPLIVGAKYQISLQYYLPSTNLLTYGFELNSAGTSIIKTVPEPATEDAWTTVTTTTPYTAAFTSLRIVLSNGGSTSFTANGTDVVYFKNITVTRVGAILDADLSAGVGYQVPDRSSNKYHGVVSASGTNWTLAQRRGQLRVSTTTSGDNQLLGSQVCLPTNAIITSIVGYTTGTPTVYVGNVSSGSQLVASVAMSANTYTSFTLAAITTTTGNVWANVSSAVTVNWTITYMIADP